MASDTPAPTPDHPRLRRAGGALLTVLVALAGVVALLLVFQSRDRSEVEHADTSAVSALGQRYSGPPLPAEVRGGGDARPSDARIADLIERGNVVLVYGTPAPPPGLTDLARKLAGPFDPALAAAGQAVALARRAGTDGVVALASQRILRTASPADPRLERFASHWLGRPAP